MLIKSPSLLRGRGRVLVFIWQSQPHLSDLEATKQFFSGGVELWKRQKYFPKKMRVPAKFMCL
jgi:hypothetical protein